jgi:hypothetical protein
MTLRAEDQFNSRSKGRAQRVIKARYGPAIGIKQAACGTDRRQSSAF